MSTATRARSRPSGVRESGCAPPGGAASGVEVACRADIGAELRTSQELILRFRTQRIHLQRPDSELVRGRQFQAGGTHPALEEAAEIRTARRRRVLALRVLDRTELG